MAININKVIRAIQQKERKFSTLEQLILDYGILSKKLENTNNQSWYSEKGKDSKVQKTEALNTEFEKIRKSFNIPLNDLLEEKNRLTKIRQTELSKKRINTISQIAISSTTNQLDYLTEMIALKSRFSELHKLDYYFENEEELLKLLNWQ